MDRYTLSACTGSDKDFILDGLLAFNMKQTGLSLEGSSGDLSCKITDEHGTIIAGVIAQRYMQECACIDILWVSPRHRKDGLGSRLLRETERQAREQGCTVLHLDTFDFQAKDFYLKHGFEIFGCLEGCPSGHCRYYLFKRLSPA